MKFYVPSNVPLVICDAIIAANDRDISGFLSSFDRDAHVEDRGQVFVGVDRIRAWWDREFKADDITLTDVVFACCPNGFSARTRMQREGATDPATFTFRLAHDVIELMVVER